MDFRVEIERAESEVESARVEHALALKRLEQAIRKLGALTGVYRGLSAFDDDRSHAQSKRPSDPRQAGYGDPSRMRAPKGEARRRSEAILTEVWPSGLTKDQLLEKAAEQGKPIPEGTLRRALMHLQWSGRALAKDDLWFAVRGDATADTEAAGADQSNPAASFSQSPGGQP